MTKNSGEFPRIFLAVAEANSVPVLWRAVTEHLRDEDTEILTMIISDDRWRRAASLPFTREILRVGGKTAEFTVTRAEQLDKTTLAVIQQRIRQHARNTNVRFVFETLSEHEAVRIHDPLPRENDVLIAPTSLKGRPFHKHLATLKCRILFVETNEPPQQSGFDAAAQ
ncbi:MAG: hypothetical protein WBN44_06855 [Woeseiaceae bacterium]